MRAIGIRINQKNSITTHDLKIKIPAKTFSYSKEMYLKAMNLSGNRDQNTDYII